MEQWLYKRASVLHYAYNACLIENLEHMKLSSYLHILNEKYNYYC
jgi:hypothetical protein